MNPAKPILVVATKGRYYVATPNRENATFELSDESFAADALISFGTSQIVSHIEWSGDFAKRRSEAFQGVLADLFSIAEEDGAEIICIKIKAKVDDSHSCKVELYFQFCTRK